MASVFRKTLIALSLLLVATGAAWSADLTERAQGEPGLMKVLGEGNYAPVTAQKLKNARIVWVNFDVLRDRGFDVPEGGLTPDFERKLLELWGYAIPSSHDPPGAFTPEQKKFWADRYGGSGIGLNFGSGRAAIAGDFQIKGIGVTPLVGEGQSFDHAHGRASFEESLTEAIWGEVGRDFPHRSNRVVAIIDGGTSTKWEDGGIQRNALIVREDPLRPAHFIAARGIGPLKATEKDRVKKTAQRLSAVFPPINGDPAEGIRLGLAQWAERIAAQDAYAYAHRLFHGADSASNMQLNGGLLDYGTMTAQPGYGNVKVLSHAASAAAEFPHIEVFSEFELSLHDAVSETTFKKYIPDTLTNTYKDAMRKAVEREFVRLTGYPPELLARVDETPLGKELSGAVLALAKEGRSNALVDKAMPESTNRFPVAKILESLAALPEHSPEAVKSALAAQVPEERLREPLAKSYSEFQAKLAELAKSEGLELKALHAYAIEKLRLEQKDLSHLYRPNLKAENIRVVDEYLATGDRDRLWRSIDERIARGRRNYETDSSYILVLDRQRDRLHDVTTSRVFDGRDGQYRLELSFSGKDGTLDFFGEKASVPAGREGVIRLGTDGWKKVVEAPLQRVGDRMVASLPVRGNETDFEFVLRAADGRTWWKPQDRNVAVRFEAAQPLPEQLRAIESRARVVSPASLSPLGRRCLEKILQGIQP